LQRILIAVTAALALTAVRASAGEPEGWQLFQKKCPPSPCPTPVLSTTPMPAPPTQGAPARPPEGQPAPAPAAEAPAEAPTQFAAGLAPTVNMLGDVLTSPTQQCVTVTETSIVPTPVTLTPPPITVTPPPFTTTITSTGLPAFNPNTETFIFTPTARVQPPPVVVQPPPIVLPNGQVVPVASFTITPAPVTVTGTPVTVPPNSATMPVTVTQTVTVTQGAFTAQPATFSATELLSVSTQVMKCLQIFSAAARASAYKIAENESPVPQDRGYLGFNYFNDVNHDVNDRLGGEGNTTILRWTFGFEKTFLDGNASIGMRLPVGTVNASSVVPGLDDNTTDIGDLSVVFKYAFLYNRETGNVFSGGLVVTAPTGPIEFNPFNSTYLQPWLGYRYFLNDSLYLQEFSSIAVATDSRDVTLWFNDVGLGYYLYRNNSSERWLTAVVPTFEVHVNDPLNHRGAFNFIDPAGTADWVTLTGGCTFELGGRSTLAIGGNVPVTGPKPYEFEILAQLNVRF
jgi:hypothetical protein